MKEILDLFLHLQDHLNSFTSQYGALVYGLLFLIDCGMSREIDDSQGAILHITSQQFEAIYPDGTAKPL